MSLRLQSWATGLSPRYKAIARDINENGIVVVQRRLILSYCIALLKADPRSSSSGKSLNITMETVTVTSKPMDGVSYREASKQDNVGEISERNITGTKQVIDDAAARFWAKRGLQDPSKSRINYGRKLK